MAVSTRPNGHRWVTFRAPNGRRQTLRLGAATIGQAHSFDEHVQQLLVAARLGGIPGPATVEWVARIDAKYRDVLARCGLCSPRGAGTVGELVAWYVADQSGKASTATNVRVVADCLNRFFGRERLLTAIGPEHANRFRDWLARSGGSRGDALAPTTVSRMCRRARSIFEAAKKRRWLVDNPFADQKGWIDTNPERDQYIPADEADRVIASLADQETKLVVALARYAGLRCPSEPAELRWEWVDWSHSTLYVRAPKTERYAGHGSRIVPLADEPLRLLSLLWQQAPDGATLICPGLHVARATLASRLESACRRSGLAMWPKPFINLRASCEHDWLRKHPIDAVAAWMGHSPETMLRHYNRVVKEQSARQAAAGSAEARGGDPVKQKAKRQNRSPRTPANDCEPL